LNGKGFVTDSHLSGAHGIDNTSKELLNGKRFVTENHLSLGINRLGGAIEALDGESIILH